MVAVLALGIEAVFGYPDALYTRIGHPVTWIGALLGGLDRRLNLSNLGSGMRRAAGVVAIATVVALAAGIGVLLERGASQSWIGVLLIAVIASTLFAARSLYRHVAEVAVALERNDLAKARERVGRVVGRDTASLDAHGVARAAIESLAENASDGVVAPLFWFVLLGLPGLAAYKAINTADSMIGHRTSRHEDFGWAAARLDDLVNLPASRLTGFLFALSASMTRAGARAAVTTMLRDAHLHRSPNAGWPESAMAGALDLKLNGPKVYGNRLVEDAYMGDGRGEATAADIRRALRLTTVAWAILFGALGTLAVILRS